MRYLGTFENVAHGQSFDKYSSLNITNFILLWETIFNFSNQEVTATTGFQ